MKQPLRLALWFGAALLGVAMLTIGLLKCMIITTEEIDAVAKLVTGLGLVGGAGWAVISYSHSKKLEFQKYFNERQVEIVLLTAETVGDLLATDPAPPGGDLLKWEKSHLEWEKRTARFWELYLGRLVLFEDEDVIKAMIALGEQLNQCTYERRNELRARIYQVSLALRDFLEKKNKHDWEISFDLDGGARQLKKAPAKEPPPKTQK